MAHEHQIAPGRLELVREFVNSIDIEHGPEELTDPKALGAWLRKRDLLAANVKLTQPDLDRAIAVREALRAVLLAHNGQELEPATIRTLNDVGCDAPFKLRFHEDADPELVTQGEGVDKALGSLMGIVAASIADDTWERLKACPWHTCLWAFYDNSKNRSGTWCSMEECGNRAKAKAYRERQKLKA
ncbi:MAG: CGNR zinc finger domain-containing protein [Thermoleophilaceae bacterium]|nr:CGNR zinc finger domain-containing protein [Thermoleophilaceae bacterium]